MSALELKVRPCQCYHLHGPVRKWKKKWVNMPLSNFNQMATDAPLMAPPTSYSSNAFPTRLRVLVVDDDPTWLKILEKMLKKCSYQESRTGILYNPAVTTQKSKHRRRGPPIF
ncbi:uncharacterized protein LOC111382632 isoform X2 [Olea europaea var. sylvestris]|uniref:uncharacterized protein LOC111382632 isoform X2 n=1 Tax=Olea europaea var. sylvestris TaxID=158386 RepID=UPI000C1D2FD3|nr:uncharacterized protein LOC111382632 isoform X2 [Olea europaea var. sylvestris]